jgi:hypothetical protein
MTFAKACSHINNYTSAHESGRYVDWSYPDNHIEVDNRLSWFLGPLDDEYPDGVRYLHLQRRREDVVESFVRSGAFDGSILRAYAFGILQRRFEGDWLRKAAGHYVDTVDANIRRFLWARLQKVLDSGKPLLIERADSWFPWFWNEIGAVGDLEAAIGEFGTRYNRGRT